MVTLRAAKATRLAKYYGTQYTSTPAAHLLASLAINLPCPLDLGSVPLTYASEPLRIVDFACGDGALITAIYDELLRRVRRNPSGTAIQALHRYLLDSGLWGFDVQSDAIRVAASRLKAHNPQDEMEPRHLFVMPLGHSEHRFALGSLSLLPGQPRSRTEPTGEHPAVPAIPLFHLAIMNPPFTRSVGGNLVFGDLPAASRRALQQELRRLLREVHLEGTGQAGLGAAFLGLADCYLKPGGRLAMVLPKTLLSGVAWRGIRELLVRTYHIEVIVASFEGPDAWNFSERTSLSEVLFLARKHSSSDHASANCTLFVNLWRKPTTEEEVASVSCQVLHLYRHANTHRSEQNAAPIIKLRCGDDQVGEGYATLLTTTEFGPHQLFAQGALNRTATLLRQGTLCIPTAKRTKRLTLAPITLFAEAIGPDVRQVHAAFRSDQHPSAAGLGSSRKAKYGALWNHDSTRVLTIAQSVNAALIPRREDTASRLWKCGSAQLLLAERAWLTSVRVMAALTPKPVLSNVWWPVRPRGMFLRDGSRLDTLTVAQLLALWLNSTLGLLLFLSQAETTRGPWVKFKKRPLHNLPVVDLAQLENGDVKSLRHTYAEVHKQRLQPLPLEFANPQVRQRIDHAFNRTLDLDTDLTPLYRLLAQDPTLTCERLSHSSSKSLPKSQTAL